MANGLAVIDFDDSVLRARLDLVNSNRVTARREALRVLTRLSVRYIIANADRDTNRFVRAYQMAGNDLGVGPFVVDPVEPGRYEANVRRLLAQLRKHDFRMRAYIKADRMYYKGVKKSGLDKGYVKAKKLRDRAEAELNKLRDAGEDAGAILIGGKKGSKTIKQLATVRTTVYGGEGRWEVHGDQTFAVIHNKEPHANFVNRRSRVVTDAMRAARRVGGRRVSDRYLREVAAGTPWLEKRAG